MFERWIKAGTVFLLALACLACGSKINAENFAKVKKGMTMEETIAILGEPTDLKQGDLGVISGANAVWRDGERSVAINFVNDKVMTKSFDEQGGGE
ncbi:DUF3862 domain-containing protein [Acanthopleuribacter pedis]|uniref:DUF3862 domain-containing protein n=1 Tax=Acanthopleuribacter pedis TaxID=442870 RepID=A0A8J7Q774_9BACT|nr:DUF3862 domain-containing protein [Acanthopleuribacter pedis]MBO1319561.1 DUF3862 domain-containing protein [Acanthopleuribacter pedis]